MPSPIDAIIARLQAERKQLDYEFKVEIPKIIGIARDHGDLSENAEYHAARERHAFVKAQLAQLDERINALRSIDMRQISHDKAGLYSHLRLNDVDSGDEVRYQLVTSEEADFDKGLISISSPIGRGLVGKQEGAEVKIQVPSGVRTFEVIELRTLHAQTAQAEPSPAAE
jgi:transcription elongation factor GreA